LIPDWTYFYCPGTTLVNKEEACSRAVVPV